MLRGTCVFALHGSEGAALTASKQGAIVRAAVLVNLKRCWFFFISSDLYARCNRVPVAST